ncbi:hypothetical protein [Chitinophaga sp. RAB17]|uniref:hypothetical protein n=1 Tax=Chitinophaga sp. RAB17 TaxID=3233049 RepID=UPI003F90BE66
MNRHCQTGQLSRVLEHLQREEMVLEPDHLPTGSKRLAKKKQNNRNVRRLNYMQRNISGINTCYQQMKMT